MSLYVSFPKIRGFPVSIQYRILIMLTALKTFIAHMFVHIFEEILDNSAHKPSKKEPTLAEDNVPQMETSDEPIIHMD
jgi:hypothetical protein